MNGSEEARGATEGSTTSKNMNKQSISLVRSKTVRYGRHTKFGAVGDNDEYIGTTHYTSNSNMPTPGEGAVCDSPRGRYRHPNRPLHCRAGLSQAQERSVSYDNSAPPRNPAHRTMPAIKGSRHKGTVPKEQRGSRC